MSDIFHEVEEEVRRERLEKIWKEYGDYIVAAACLLIIAVAGLQLWRVYEQRESAKASESYMQAEQLYEAGQIDMAAQAFAHLASTAPSGYSAVSRLQEADAMMASGKHDDAIALYKKIAAGDNRLLSDVARIHEAWGIADTASRADLDTLLAPLTDANSAWRFTAQEILAYSDYHNGQTAKAKQEYASLAATSGLPLQMRARVLAMSTFLKAGGGKDYGHVPVPAVDAAEQAAIQNAIKSAQANGSAQAAKANGATPAAPQAPPTAQGQQKK